MDSSLIVQAPTQSVAASAAHQPSELHPHAPACHLRSPRRNLATQCTCGAYLHDDELWKTIHPSDVALRERAKARALVTFQPKV